MLGDHIRALKNGRWLHGIDLGDQRVLFLDERPGLAPGDRLRRVYRPEFAAGASRVELVVHRGPAYPAKAVVARAWSRFMDPSVVSMFRDSEAFAAWCKIGRLPETAPGAPPAAADLAAAVKAPPAPQAAPRAAAAPRPAPAKKAPAAPKPAPKKPAPKAKPAKAAGKAPARKAPAKKAAGRPAPAKPPARKAKAAPKKSAARARPAKAPAKRPARKAPARKKGR